MAVINRRQFLLSTGAVAATSLFSPLWAGSRFPEKKLKLYNTHTGEWFNAPYAINGHYIPEQMGQLSHLMRDWRTHESTPMDPKLIDLLHEVSQKFGSGHTIEIISAYRCPKTNNALREAGNRVAKNSFHITGQAIDFKIANASLKDVRNAAYTTQAKGVGYYPSSNFVHIDTGPRPHRTTQARW